MTPSERSAKIRAVIRVAAGNFLEMYDFMVFGYYAAAIGRAFFPKGNEVAQLMLAFATFGVGFLMRPLGALILGAYIGSWLLAGAYLAITSMTSAMTRNQVISFIVAVVLCLALILLGFTPITDLLGRYAGPNVVEGVASFGVLTHFDGFNRGVLDIRDVLYFFSIMVFALVVTAALIRNRRA